MNFLVNFWGEFVNFWVFWGRGVNFWDKFTEFGREFVNFLNFGCEFGKNSRLLPAHSSLRGVAHAEAIHYATKSRFLGANLHFKNARGAWRLASHSTNARNDGLLCHSERNEVKRRIHELKAILRLWIFRYAQNDKMVANSVNFNANSAQNSLKFTKFTPQNSQKFSHKNARGALWIASTATQSRNDGLWREFLRKFNSKFTNFPKFTPKFTKIQPKKCGKKALNDKI